VTLAGANREAVVVRDGRYLRDQDLASAVTAIGYATTVIPTRTVELSVQNLGCGGCPDRARAAVRRLFGTKHVAVRRATAAATVTYDTRRLRTTQIVEALRTAGFPATPRR
jgi:copper chaperone CopZ